MRVAVLGGGVSGLSAAYRLQQHGINVTLFEGTARVGGSHSLCIAYREGWIETDTSLGHVLEAGPRSIRPVGLAGATTLEMVHKLGLENSIIVRRKDHITAKNRFILFNNILNKLPSSPLDLLLNRPPVLKGVVWSAFKELFVTKGSAKDETIHQFISRRFGMAVAENLVSAIVHGIYAGDIKKLSVRSTFPSMWNAERTFGSIILGLIRTPKQLVDLSTITTDPACKSFIESTMGNSLYSFQNGLATFTDSLSLHLSKQANVMINKNAHIDHIDPATREIRYRSLASKASSQFTRKEPTGNYLHLKDTSISQTFEYIISSLPSSAYPQITGLSSALQEVLAEIPYQDVIVTNFVFVKQELPIKGFGFLIPSSQKMDVLGVILDSETLFEQERGEVCRITVMQRRAYHKQHSSCGANVGAVESGCTVELSDAEYIEKCWTVLHHLDLDKPGVLEVRVRRQMKCIAQYVLGHDENVRKIRREFGGVEVCGSSYDGVSINDCVLSGVNAANRVLDQIKAVKI